VQLKSIEPRPTKPAAAQAGFTLIELMIVVTVICVLALIGYPILVKQVDKSRRADAIAALSRIAQAQERWRANNPTYAKVNDAAPGDPPNGVLDPSTPSYKVEVPSHSSTGYTATATARGAQAGDTECTSLVLTMASGNLSYTSTGSASDAKCWNR
jgi:type IV pilus assembly protein PilE